MSSLTGLHLQPYSPTILTSSALQIYKLQPYNQSPHLQAHTSSLTALQPLRRVSRTALQPAAWQHYGPTANPLDAPYNLCSTSHPSYCGEKQSPSRYKWCEQFPSISNKMCVAQWRSIAGTVFSEILLKAMDAPSTLTFGGRPQRGPDISQLDAAATRKADTTKITKADTT